MKECMTHTGDCRHTKPIIQADHKRQDLLLAMRTFEYSEYVFYKSPLIIQAYSSVMYSLSIYEERD